MSCVYYFWCKYAPLCTWVRVSLHLWGWSGPVQIWRRYHCHQEQRRGCTWPSRWVCAGVLEEPHVPSPANGERGDRVTMETDTSHLGQLVDDVTEITPVDIHYLIKLMCNTFTVLHVTPQIPQSGHGLKVNICTFRYRNVMCDSGI